MKKNKEKKTKKGIAVCIKYKQINTKVTKQYKRINNFIFNFFNCSLHTMEHTIFIRRSSFLICR
jgi:hypothetical protein